jgi:hypothetical protein
MKISRYVNNVKVNERDLTKYYLNSEIVNKAIYAVNNRAKTAETEAAKTPRTA